MDEQKTNDRYRMTITDTETGKVIADERFSVIIAGCFGDKNNAVLSSADAPLGTIVLCIAQAMRAIEKTKDSIKAKGRMSAEALERAIKLAQLTCDIACASAESKCDEADDDSGVAYVGGDKQ